MNDAEPAVENAAIEHVLAPKPKRGPQRDVAEGRAASRGSEIRGTHPAIGDEFVQVMSQILVGRVVQLVGELALLAFGDLEARMCGFAPELSAALEQPDDPVATPVPAAQDVPVEIIAPLHAVRLVPRRQHYLRQFLRE